MKLIINWLLNPKFYRFTVLFICQNLVWYKKSDRKIYKCTIEIEKYYNASIQGKCQILVNLMTSMISFFLQQYFDEHFPEIFHTLRFFAESLLKLRHVEIWLWCSSYYVVWWSNFFKTWDRQVFDLFVSQAIWKDLLFDFNFRFIFAHVSHNWIWIWRLNEKVIFLGLEETIEEKLFFIIFWSLTH